MIQTASFHTNCNLFSIVPDPSHSFSPCTSFLFVSPIHVFGQMILVIPRSLSLPLKLKMMTSVAEEVTSLCSMTLCERGKSKKDSSKIKIKIRSYSSSITFTKASIHHLIHLFISHIFTPFLVACCTTSF